jgi:outer membrane protein assembly factor BamB
MTKEAQMTKSESVWMTATVVAALWTPPAAADWPQFRGPTGMGVSTEKGLPVTWSQRSNVQWKIKLPGGGTSSPIAVGDRLFLTAFSGYMPGRSGGDLSQLRLHVLCLKRADGSLLWDKTIEPKLPEQASMRENHGYASSTPAADSECVYGFFGKSGVVAFTHDGKQLWHESVGTGLQDDGFGSGASLMLAGDKLIVNASYQSQTLFALDKRTGKQVWKAPGIRESWNTPILVDAGGKQELVLAIQGKLMALDPATGAPLWNCRTDIGWYMVPSLVAEKGIVGCIGGRSGVVGLAVRAGGNGDVTASHRLWTSTKGSNVSSPIVHDGHLYWMNDGLGIAYCANLETGAIRYEERIPGAGAGVYASPVLADGRIYYVGRDGQTFVVAAKPTFELLATNDLRDRSQFNASPAVSGGRIYLRSEQYLYCLGAK